MENIPLAWNANTESDLAGYRIHCGPATNTYTEPGFPVDVGNVTTTTISVQANGLKFIAAVAYNTSALTSTFSNEISRNVVLPFSGVAVFRGGAVHPPAPTVRRA